MLQRHNFVTFGLDSVDPVYCANTFKNINRYDERITFVRVSEV